MEEKVTYSANTSKVQVNVKGYKLIQSLASNKIKVYANEDTVELRVNGTFTFPANQLTDLATISYSVPNNIICSGHHRNNCKLVVSGNTIKVQSNDGATSTGLYAIIRFAK